MTHHQTGEEIRLSKAKQAKTKALLDALPSQKAKLRLLDRLQRVERAKASAKGRAFK